MKRPTLLALYALLASQHAFALDDYGAAVEEELSVVFTPSRLEQHRKNVPAGVTVITSKKLKTLGITSFPEAMRLVPGMRVNQASGWDYRVNFHGTNALIPRRMLVLIDGMSVYRYGYAQVDWNRLAIDVEDIERIEVTRSPSAASYGSNAFQVVVNVITKHPQDVEPLSISAETGTENTERYHARASGRIGDTAILASVSKHSDDGFDWVSFDQYKDPVPGAVDDQDVERFLIRTETDISLKDTLELRFGGVRADIQEEEVDANQIAPPEKSQQDWHAHATYSHIFNQQHFVKAQAYIRKSDFDERWRACHPAALYLPELRDLADVNTGLALAIVNGNPQPGSTPEENALLQNVLVRLNELGPSAFQPLCGDGNHDNREQSIVLEVEDTYQPFESVRINTGIGYRDNYTDSETLSNGKVGSEHLYIFSNAEVFLSEDFVLNAGFILEDASNVEDPVFNPRIGLNFHYLPQHTVRVAYSTASRLPNILETDRDWNYYVRNWDREFAGQTEGYFFLNTQTPGTLEPEEIESAEVGFFGSGAAYTYDVRVFKEWLSNLISEKATFFNFNPSNESEATLQGVEAEFTYRVSPVVELSAGYSYIDNEYTNFFEQTAHSDHAGFANASYYSALGTFSLAYYGNSVMAGEAYDRWDATYLNSFKMGARADLGLRLTASYMPSLDHAYQIREDSRVVQHFDEEWHYRAELTLSF